MNDIKKHASILSAAGVLALCLSMPAQAEVVAMDDSDLDKIQGKGHILTKASAVAAGGSTIQGHVPNTVESGGNLSVDESVGDGDGNQQIGYYQWSDNHGTDASDHKGGNDQSGSFSTVQSAVVATTNGISWGAFGSNSNVAGLVGSTATQETDTRASLFIGGF